MVLLMFWLLFCSSKIIKLLGVYLQKGFAKLRWFQFLFYSLLFGGIQQGQVVPQLQKKALIICSKLRYQLNNNLTNILLKTAILAKK